MLLALGIMSARVIKKVLVLLVVVEVLVHLGRKIFTNGVPFKLLDSVI